MAFDFTYATAEEIATELSKYSVERRLLQYKITEEEILTIGQENWNGDKKNYQAQLQFIRAGIAECEKQIATKKLASKCPIKSCDVSFY